MISKKIKINPRNEDAGFSGHAPTPAKKHIPSWYKSHPTFQGGTKKFELGMTSSGNATMKWCNPFVDAMSSGYMILLEHDIMISDSPEGTSTDADIRWTRPGQWIEGHHPDQFSDRLSPSGFSKDLLKFKVDWHLEVPEGYSLLYAHPLNRYDLPFISMTGIVDSDTYKDRVNIPFFLKKDFRGIIEAGTPIAQVIPIKREPWKSELTDFNKEESLKIRSLFRSKIFRSYKNQFWHRKDYS